MMEPMEHFDLCIIGSGSGNTIVNRRFADRRVALVDQGAFGGTCLNSGCIPTKMFVVPADLAVSPLEAPQVNVDLRLTGISFPAVRDRIFSRTDQVSADGRAWRQNSDNVSFFPFRARFRDPHTLELGGYEISASEFVIAAGSRPRIPQWEGLEDSRVREFIHTSDTIMRLPALPKRLVILGGGAIAAEFAHIFSGFGSKVTVVHRSDLKLRTEDATIAERFTELLSRRVPLRLNQHVTSIVLSEVDDGVTVIANDVNNIEYLYPADAVLVATGRVPNSDTLNLDAAGVAVDEDGFIEVDPWQRTTAGHIWALGDVCHPAMLKHVANAEARAVQHNLLHPEDLRKAEHAVIPHAVFSHPQVASVGKTEREVAASGVDYVCAVQDYNSVAYGWALNDQDHLVKLLAERASGLLLGAHIIGPEASSLIQPLIQAMSFGQAAHEVARGQYWIHPGLPEVVENALLSIEELRKTAERLQHLAWEIAGDSGSAE